MPSLHKIFLDKKIVFLDMDGTIYLGNRLLPGAKNVLAALEQAGIDCIYLSNNSSRSKADYALKLGRLGIEAKEENIILSTDGVIDFLLQQKIRHVYVVGTKSMKEMFIQAGIETESKNPSFIILGFDTELDYEKIRTASFLIQKGVPLIATHCDIVCPTPEGPVPDVGSLLALFEKATHKKADRVFGKPHPEMIKHVLLKYGAEPQDVVIIGDRLYTDMEMALRIGCEFVLVLSGETRSEDLQRLENPPALVVDNIGQLIGS
jgi:HAD superfamily hydrolase (TIGR01450 family)